MFQVKRLLDPMIEHNIKCLILIGKSAVWPFSRLLTRASPIFITECMKYARRRDGANSIIDIQSCGCAIYSPHAFCSSGAAYITGSRSPATEITHPTGVLLVCSDNYASVGRRIVAPICRCEMAVGRRERGHRFFLSRRILCSSIYYTN